MTAVTTGSVELDDALVRFADVVVSVSPDVAFAVIEHDLVRYDDDGLPVLPDWHVVVRGDAGRVQAFIAALGTTSSGLWVSIEIDDEPDDDDTAPVPYSLTDSAWAVERRAAYSRSRMVGRVVVAVVAFVVFFVLGALAAARAVAAGSDAPTPYIVTSAGITFPAPLAAHGHVNVRLTDGRTAGLHLDPNNGHPGRAWIGATFLPWSALGVVDGCIAWVQWSGANEHHGEGGQAPVCLIPTSTPEPTWTPNPTASPTPSPEPTTSPTPTEPSATPTPTASPEPEPTPGPSTTPTTSPTPSPTPVSTATSTPSASPTPTPAPAATTPPSPTSPAASPSTPPVAERSEVSAATDDDTTASPRAEVLAATGTTAQAAFVVGAVLVFLGLMLWGVGHGRRGGAR